MSSTLMSALFAALLFAMAGPASAAGPIVLSEAPVFEEAQAFDVLEGGEEAIPGDATRALEYAVDGRLLGADPTLHVRVTGPDVDALSVIIVGADGRTSALSPAELSSHVDGQELDVWLKLPEVVSTSSEGERDGPALTLQLFHVREAEPSVLVLLESVVGEDGGAGQASGPPESGDDDDVLPEFSVDAEMQSVHDDDDDDDDDGPTDDDDNDTGGPGCECSLADGERNWVVQSVSIALVLGMGLALISRRQR